MEQSKIIDTTKTYHPARPIFTSKHSRPSRGGRRKTSSGAASPGWLTRGGGIKARGTSRGFYDASHDDWSQAGANTRSVLVSSLVLKGQAQTRSPEASCKGFHIGATRPRPAGWQDGGHLEPKTASPLEPLAGEDYFCQDSLY